MVGAQVLANDSVASGNNDGSTGYGYLASGGAVIYCAGSTATGNKHVGYYAYSNSTLECPSSKASAHNYNILSSVMGSLLAADSSVSYGTTGTAASTMSYLYASGVSRSNCTVDSSPVVNTIGNTNSIVSN
jgi:hypothetical protein